MEKVLSKGRLLRYGEVLAAEYQGESVGTKRVFRWQLPDGEWSYFQEDGTSARKAFLKSPLKFAHVTSRFGRRFHPVLQYLKAHKGVDYAAAVGTPVWAVADGTVTARQHRPGGNTVCVRHRNGLETCYLHLSSYGRGVRGGARVSQKQVIGYSGNTGRSTGPHLHFAMKRDGAFVNPLNQKFPRSRAGATDPAGVVPDRGPPIAASLDAPSLATVTRLATEPSRGQPPQRLQVVERRRLSLQPTLLGEQVEMERSPVGQKERLLPLADVGLEIAAGTRCSGRSGGRALPRP